jgi:hypothetical protein
MVLYTTLGLSADLVLVLIAVCIASSPSSRDSLAERGCLFGDFPGGTTGHHDEKAYYDQVK